MKLFILIKFTEQSKINNIKIIKITYIFICEFNYILTLYSD